MQSTVTSTTRPHADQQPWLQYCKRVYHAQAAKTHRQVSLRLQKIAPSATPSTSEGTQAGPGNSISLQFLCIPIS